MLITSFIINKKNFYFLIFFNHYSDNQESLYNFMGILIGGDICLTPFLDNELKKMVVYLSKYALERLRLKQIWVVIKEELYMELETPGLHALVYKHSEIIYG